MSLAIIRFLKSEHHFYITNVFHKKIAILNGFEKSPFYVILESQHRMRRIAIYIHFRRYSLYSNYEGKT